MSWVSLALISQFTSRCRSRKGNLVSKKTGSWRRTGLLFRKDHIQTVGVCWSHPRNAPSMPQSEFVVSLTSGCSLGSLPTT
eukprot:292594-Rhodomonas_salina.1